MGIPFASGTPCFLNELGQAALVAFGNNASNVPFVGPNLDLTTGPLTFPLNMAFSMPRAGVLQQLAVFYSSVSANPFFADIVFQLYRSATPDNLFLPVPGTVITLSLPAHPPGTFVSGTAAFAVPVGLGDRLLLAAHFTNVSPPPNPNPAIDVGDFGYISGGLSIA